MKEVTVLIPTYNRSAALAVTLSSLCFQSLKEFDVVISDQSDEAVEERAEVTASRRVLEHHGSKVNFKRNLPRQGMAQQRQFLLNHAESKYVLFLDDDVLLEPWALETMVHVMNEERCGLTGMFVIALSYKDDVRPHHQKVEFWDETVQPETIEPGGEKWQRASLHSAANVLHLQEQLNATPSQPTKYKIAWIGACKLYDREKLKSTNAFNFWHKLPEQHSGEDVMAQLKVIEQYGGCGILPSGAYHQEVGTTIPDRDKDAFEMLDL